MLLLVVFTAAAGGQGLPSLGAQRFELIDDDATTSAALDNYKRIVMLRGFDSSSFSRPFDANGPTLAGPIASANNTVRPASTSANPDVSSPSFMPLTPQCGVEAIPSHLCNPPRNDGQEKADLFLLEAAFSYLDPPGSVAATELGWAPAKRVANGSNLVARWRKLADAGVPFDCVQSKCSIVVHAFNRAPSQADGLLARCQVTSLEATALVPHDCVAIAMNIHGEPWARALTRPRDTVPPSGFIPQPPPIEYFIAKIYRDPLPVVDEVKAKLTAALTGPPLLLGTHIVDATVYAYRACAPSRVLAPWAEDVQFAIVIARRADDGKAYLGVITSDHPLRWVTPGRSNCGSSDWQPPSPDQENQYLAQLQQSVIEQLRKMCDQFARPDSDTLVCAN